MLHKGGTIAHFLAAVDELIAPLFGEVLLGQHTLRAVIMLVGAVLVLLGNAV